MVHTCCQDSCRTTLYLGSQEFSKYQESTKTPQNDSAQHPEFLLHIKVEGPEPKEAAEKMCANADALWWDSKEHHTTQRKRKNYTDRKKKNQNDSLTLLLINIWII